MVAFTTFIAVRRKHGQIRPAQGRPGAAARISHRRCRARQPRASSRSERRPGLRAAPVDILHAEGVRRKRIRRAVYVGLDSRLAAARLQRAGLRWASRPRAARSCARWPWADLQCTIFGA